MASRPHLGPSPPINMQTVEQIIKNRYWDLYKKEKLGETPEITNELDHIEKVLRTLRSEPELKICFDPSSEAHDTINVLPAKNSLKFLTSGDGEMQSDSNTKG
jgi:hypothetical protein